MSDKPQQAYSWELKSDHVPGYGLKLLASRRLPEIYRRRSSAPTEQERGAANDHLIDFTAAQLSGLAIVGSAVYLAYSTGLDKLVNNFF